MRRSQSPDRSVDPATGQPGGSNRPSALTAPGLDREALIAADLVAMSAKGPMYERVRDAITAYVYSVANARDGRLYPSDAEVAAVVAQARLERQR